MSGIKIETNHPVLSYSNPVRDHFPLTKQYPPITKSFDIAGAEDQYVSLGVSPTVPQAVEEKKESSRISYVKELFKKAWSLFASDSTKEGEAKVFDPSLEPLDSRPVLDKPILQAAASHRALMNVFQKTEDEKKVKAIRDETDEIDLNPTKNHIFQSIDESELDMKIFEMQKTQVTLREKEGVTLKDGLLQDAEEKKRLWNQYINLKETAANRAKYSKVFSWISVGTGVVGASVFIGGAIIAIVGSAGTAIPAVLVVGGGLAAIAGGGSGVSGSVLGFLGSKAAGESFTAKELGNLKKDEIIAKLQNMEQNDNSIAQMWGNISQMLRNIPSNMFR